MTDNAPASTAPVASTARVATDRPARYGKQLASHFSKRIESRWDESTGTGELPFGDGACRLQVEGEALILELTAPDDSVEGLEDVVGRHLVRFGHRDELVVAWVRPDGSAGSTQRYD